MNRLTTIAAACMLLVCASASRADIIAWTCDNDHDGAINCVVPAGGWGYDAAEALYNMQITGSQFCEPGHMVGQFTLDQNADPTIKVANYVTNDTTFPWTAYRVDVTLQDAQFTFASESVTAPDGWSVGSIIQPSLPDSSGNYTGTIYFQGGRPVANDGVDELDFNYKFSFTGSPGGVYNYSQHMTPIPEPGTMALLAGGLLAFVALRRRIR
jgi:hypothetical protein